APLRPQWSKQLLPPVHALAHGGKVVARAAGRYSRRLLRRRGDQRRAFRAVPLRALVHGVAGAAADAVYRTPGGDRLAGRRASALATPFRTALVGADPGRDDGRLAHSVVPDERHEAVRLGVLAVLLRAH